MMLPITQEGKQLVNNIFANDKNLNEEQESFITVGPPFFGRRVGI